MSVGGIYIWIQTLISFTHKGIIAMKYRGLETPGMGRSAGALCSWAGLSPASLPGISHHHLHSVLLSLKALIAQTVLDNEFKFRITKYFELEWTHKSH